MAVYRETPKCIHCGKPIAKGIYNNYEDLPRSMRPYGDSFIRWEYKECNCKESKKARKKLKKSIPRKLIEELNNMFNKKDKND